MATDKIIVALDMNDADYALEMVKRLKDYIGCFKVGNQLFTRQGPSIVQAIRDQGVDVFLDLKFHDIPATVANAVAASVKLDVRFLTIHTMGGADMMIAALDVAQGTRTTLLGVTVLTSLESDDLQEIGFDHTVKGQVLHLTRLAIASGLSAIVCSPQEIELIRSQVKEPLTLVTPGIRATAAVDKQDQKRTLSASEAFAAGANHVVIGRPITQAPDPVAAARDLVRDCKL
ncbi:MAG: orotidine-5'-phosphate decarboxylase [Candidatus Methylacidiphilales bacterium]|nr:orotidine-5'-phosphate decarboxylase [Candidatus Methylacidiphilales bacterium]